MCLSLTNADVTRALDKWKSCVLGRFHRFSQNSHLVHTLVKRVLIWEVQNFDKATQYTVLYRTLKTVSKSDQNSLQETSKTAVDTGHFERIFTRFLQFSLIFEGSCGQIEMKVSDSQRAQKNAQKHYRSVGQVSIVDSQHIDFQNSLCKGVKKA
jgi:hypothetical protein